MEMNTRWLRTLLGPRWNGDDDLALESACPRYRVTGGEYAGVIGTVDPYRRTVRCGLFALVALVVPPDIDLKQGAEIYVHGAHLEAIPCDANHS